VTDHVEGPLGELAGLAADLGPLLALAGHAELLQAATQTVRDLFAAAVCWWRRSTRTVSALARDVAERTGYLPRSILAMPVEGSQQALGFGRCLTVMVQATSTLTKGCCWSCCPAGGPGGPAGTRGRRPGSGTLSLLPSPGLARR
jgi:hypothetical protein